jgi:hypothetical protein
MSSALLGVQLVMSSSDTHLGQTDRTTVVWHADFRADCFAGCLALLIFCADFLAVHTAGHGGGSRRGRLLGRQDLLELRRALLTTPPVVVPLRWTPMMAPLHLEPAHAVQLLVLHLGLESPSPFVMATIPFTAELTNPFPVLTLRLLALAESHTPPIQSIPGFLNGLAPLPHTLPLHLLDNPAPIGFLCYAPLATTILEKDASAVGNTFDFLGALAPAPAEFLTAVAVAAAAAWMQCSPVASAGCNPLPFSLRPQDAPLEFSPFHVFGLPAPSPLSRRTATNMAHLSQGTL